MHTHLDHAAPIRCQCFVARGQFLNAIIFAHSWPCTDPSRSPSEMISSYWWLESQRLCAPGQRSVTGRTNKLLLKAVWLLSLIWSHRKPPLVFRLYTSRQAWWDSSDCLIGICSQERWAPSFLAVSGKHTRALKKIQARSWDFRKPSASPYVRH